MSFRFLPDNFVKRAMAWRFLRLVLHPHVLFTLVALTVWLPGGFNIGPVNDGWIKLEQFLGSGRIYVAHGTRVFGSVPRELGMHLDSGSFLGWEGMLFLLTVLRASLFYEIVKRLFPARAALAVGCGLLALFHPADDVFFWVDVTGAHLGLVLSLAACLCALINLQTGNRTALFGMLFFQIASCLTYSAFLVLMLAFSPGVWLLHRMEGGKTSWVWLLKSGWLIASYVVLQVLLVLSGFGGHESQVADLNLGSVLMGYASETLLFFRKSWDSIAAFKPMYFVWALAPALLGGFTARAIWSGDALAGETGRDRRWYAVLCIGLILLAAACYLPYATSNVRFGAQRQLFGAGIFLYMLLVLPLFLWLPRKLQAPQFPWLLVALLAGFVTLTGLEKRDIWVSAYRAEEQLLAGIAATIPQPPSGTMFMIHLHTIPQTHSLAGFYNRRHTLELALHLMYGDPSLRASFTPYRGTQFEFKDNRLSAVQIIDGNNYDNFVSLAKTVILDYAPDGKLRVLDRDWLQQYFPKGTDLTAYAPGGYGSAPRAGTIICTMLEAQFRPGYCGAR